MNRTFRLLVSTVSLALSLALTAGACTPQPPATEVVADPAPASSAEASQTEKVTVEAAAAAAVAVYNGVMKAYDVYNRVKSFFVHAPSVAEQIEAAKATIVAEIRRVRGDELAAEFRALVDAYGEIVRNPNNPTTVGRLGTWMDRSQVWFENHYPIFADLSRDPDAATADTAYVLAPAFNAIAALRITVLNGIPELGVPEYDATSRATFLRKVQVANYRMVGALKGWSPDRGEFGAFWGSSLWRSPRFAGGEFVCRHVECHDDTGRPLGSEPEWCSLLSANCHYTCPWNNFAGYDESCIEPELGRVQARFFSDPVVNLVRFSLARATQNHPDGTYQLWDDWFGLITIVEA